MFYLLRVRERDEVAYVLPFEGERKWPKFFLLRVRETEEVAYVLPFEGEGVGEVAYVLPFDGMGERGSGQYATFQGVRMICIQPDQH